MNPEINEMHENTMNVCRGGVYSAVYCHLLNQASALFNASKEESVFTHHSNV
jgi:hypothetical protein